MKDRVYNPFPTTKQLLLVKRKKKMISGWKLTPERKKTCILRSAVAVHPGKRCSSTGTRMFCRCVNRVRRRVSKAVPWSSSRRRTDRRIVFLEEATNSDRICSRSPRVRRRSCTRYGRLCSVRCRNIRRYRNDHNAPERTGPLCSRSSRRCSWCRWPWRTWHILGGMARILDAFCLHCSQLDKTLDRCL